MYLIPSSFLCSICLLLWINIFGEAMGLKGAKNDPILVLNAKGGEIKAKANGSAKLMNFENNRVRIFDLSKMLLLQNLVSCGGEFWLWEKGEFLGTWINFTLEISLYVPKQACLT
jgi:hypothetical protein